ncbi:hypothetical protein ACET3Z_008959 [Daucus carota]
MDGGKGAHHLTANQQAGPKKQKKGETSKGKSREERLDMYIAHFKDLTLISAFAKDVDTSRPHRMTFREYASMRLDEIENENFDLEGDYSNITDAGPVVRVYDPEANIRVFDPNVFTEIMDCSRLAIEDYNKSNGTHFEVVNLLKANAEALCAYRYYITFEAIDKTQNITQSFQAKVAVCIPITVRDVQLVRIRQPPEPYSP